MEFNIRRQLCRVNVIPLKRLWPNCAEQKYCHIDDIERIVNNPGIRTFQPIMRHFVDPFTISSKPEHMVRMIFDHVITDTNHDIGTVKTASDIVVGLQTYRSEGKFV